MVESRWAPEIIYQDDHLLAVNKPSGLLSVPGKGPELRDSLLVRLEAWNPAVKLVHRLDRDTSGILVFAKSLEIQRALSRQFELRTNQKRYQALVEGELTGSGEITVPVRYDPTRPPLHIADPEFPKSAQTFYEVIGKYGAHTRVALKPVTGRSHQLRVHMQYLGHPILGDQLYATEQGIAAAPRLCLHAEALAIQHPVSGELLSFLCPVPF